MLAGLAGLTAIGVSFCESTSPDGVLWETSTTCTPIVGAATAPPDGATSSDREVPATRPTSAIRRMRTPERRMSEIEAEATAAGPLIPYIGRKSGLYSEIALSRRFPDGVALDRCALTK